MLYWHMTLAQIGSMYANTPMTISHPTLIKINDDKATKGKQPKQPKDHSHILHILVPVHIIYTEVTKVMG